MNSVKTKHIKTIYLYTASLIALIIMFIASIRITQSIFNLLLSTKLPDPECLYMEMDTENKANNTVICKRNAMARRYRTISSSIAMLLISTPMYLYHWKLAKKEN